MCCLFPKVQNTIQKPRSRKGLIANPATIGEKLRNRRIELNLFQKDIAALFKVSEDCITNWENNRTEIQIRYMPLAFEFLQINPYFEAGDTLGGIITRYRLLHGLSLKKMGVLLNVDASTIGSWEHGQHLPRKRILNQLYKLLKK